MKAIKNLFSTNNLNIFIIFILIMTVPGLLAVAVKTPIVLYKSINSTQIEGEIESISFTQARIKNLDKSIIFKFDCNCEIIKGQLEKSKYMLAKVIDDDGTYKALTLELDGKNIYNHIDVKGHLIILAIFLLISLICIALIKLINRKENIETKKYWEKVTQAIEILRPQLDKFRKPALRLIKTSQKSLSKFGGKPFVENMFVWPESNGKPMAFLAQIDLSEMSAEFKYDWLPNDGLLLFFYDVIEMPWGWDVQHKSQWKVIYQSRPDYIAEFPATINKKSHIKESFIKPKKIELLPDSDDIDLKSLGFSEIEIDAYIEISCESENNRRHQIGGFPSAVQGNNMQWEAHLLSNGIDPADEDKYKGEVEKLESGVAGWNLLLQFDSDSDLGVIWGDCGMIYFWVEAEKAKNKDFDNCWLILQCS